MKIFSFTIILILFPLFLFSCVDKKRGLASISKTKVSVEIITKGDIPRGFKNSRLPEFLGPQIIIKERDGNFPGEHRLSYAVLAKFKIPENMLANEIEIKREAQYRTSYYLAGEKRETELRKTSDNPNPANFLVENGYIFVADAPGPSALIITKDPRSYPISFEGLFNLKFLYQGEILGEISYKIFIKKDNFEDSKLDSSLLIGPF
jgi:hypothetical protein